MQITRDSVMCNIMLAYSQLSLQDWLAHPNCRRYHTVSFFPSLTPTEEQLPKTAYNIFRGFRIPKTKARKGECDPLLRHVRDILCNGNEEHSEFLFNCLAQIVQTPWKRLNTAIVMQSREGAGKSILFNFMAAIIGKQCFLSESKPEALFGNFNSQLSSRVLCVAEELVWAGSKKDSSVLKDLLTSDTISINQKYCHPRVETNFINLVILTNSPWAVQAGMSARRYFVLQPSDKYTGVQNAAAKAYFDTILRVQPEAFAHWLYERDLTGFNSRQPPQTQALIQQKRQSMNAVESMVYECLQRGWILRDCAWEREINALPRSQLYTRMSQENVSLHGWPMAAQKFWHDLRQALTDKGGTSLLQDMYGGNYRKAAHQDVTMWGGYEQKDRWISLPSLQACREWWCQNMFVDTWGQ